MSQNTRFYFVFNRSERIGILSTLAIIAIVLGLPFMVKIATRDNTKEFERFVNEIVLLEKSVKFSIDSLNEARMLDFQQMDKSMAGIKIVPFTFDPNNLPSAQWSKLGLKDWQIKVIKKYEAKGGKFYDKDDFKKMFCISPSEYDILEPYIAIQIEKPVYAEIKTEIPARKPRAIVELNSADSVTLLSLYGIGPSYARRIIKYRTLLGGFYSKSQLLEVFGFDQGKLDKIEDYCSVNPNEITKININKIRTEELKKHPYLDYYTAKAIVDQRISIGKFTSLKQISEIPLIHAELFDKIKNYLVLD